MKIFGRTPRRIASVLWKIPGYIIASYRCFILFRRPLKVLWFYIKRRNPPSHQVTLRSGIVIQLTMDDSDIVTVFLIFCRHDYGEILPGSVVVDIGANIGVFALYAAIAGAKMVLAYEPAEESFYLLQANIRNNNFEKTIYPYRAAVVGRLSTPVWFPRRSNVFNAIAINSENRPDYSIVPTITFGELVGNLSGPNLIKLDCEGGEYDIILNSDDSIFDRIDEMRLEYHQGPHQKLFDRFKKTGFKRQRFMDEGEGGGYLWLTRTPSISSLCSS